MVLFQGELEQKLTRDLEGVEGLKRRRHSDSQVQKREGGGLDPCKKKRSRLSESETQQYAIPNCCKLLQIPKDDW